MRAVWLENCKLSCVENAADPLPGEGEALIRVLIAGICSTDLELVRGYYPYTGIPGHEFVGEVMSAPDNPAWVGRRVVGEINISCWNCEQCRSGRTRHCENRKTLGIHDWNGVLAEFIVLPISNLHSVPEQVTNEEAVFTEPLAAAFEILEQINVQPEDRVLVIGAGRLGQLVASVLKRTGCELDVIVRHQKQRDILARQNIHAVPASERITRKYDIIVEATGSVDGFKLASEMIRPRGRIILKSTYKGKLEVNFSKIVVDEVTLTGSRCGPFEPALAMLADRGVMTSELIEAIYSLEEGIRAFQHAGEPGVLKVLIKP